MTLTLVTSLLNYYHSKLEDSTFKRRLQRLDLLLQIKVPIVVYVSPDLVTKFGDYLHEKHGNNDHIRVVPLSRNLYESSYAYIIANNLRLQLPEHRLPPKDTLEYLCYLHSKIGFIHHVSTMNPFQTNHFAWIDYDIGNMWKEVEKNQRFIRHIHLHGIKHITQMPPTEKHGSSPVSSENEIIIPTCWEFEKRSINDLCNRVCWRFCTNFFIGTSAAIQHLYYLYTEHYERFLVAHETMTWDMNFLAFLEQEQNWKPITYTANHDDSMIQKIPVFTLSDRLPSSYITYAYPRHDGFHPSSVSCVEYMYNGQLQYIMNARYVNYVYLPSGHCDHPPHVCTVNKMVRLNTQFMIDSEFQDLHEDAQTMGLSEPDPNEMFQGIEDIRLFVWKDRLKFTATTVNYSGCARSRIVVGDYDMGSASLKNVKIIPSPTDSFKEKNWIPLISEDDPEHMRFIYSWSPFQIGTINENYEFVLEKTYNVEFPYLEEIRGSTNVVFHDGFYLALVHLSVEGTLPKQYYHMMVWLDKERFKPIKMSRLFRFDQFGVEFCLCMAIKNNEYVFWVSRQDNEAVCVFADQHFFDVTLPC